MICKIYNERTISSHVMCNIYRGNHGGYFFHLLSNMSTMIFIHFSLCSDFLVSSTQVFIVDIGVEHPPWLFCWTRWTKELKRSLTNRDQSSSENSKDQLSYSYCFLSMFNSITVMPIQELSDFKWGEISWRKGNGTEFFFTISI